MPAKHVIKEYMPNSYYHVFNRGVAKQLIFLDSHDKDYFLKIVQRHLDPTDKAIKGDGTAYRKFDKDLELLCYCLMGNHFHLLFYQAQDPDAVTGFMRSLATAYTMYFNKKYKRVGPLFQGIFKASRIDTDDYLLHITRYIHLNPRTYKTYHYSSLRNYVGEASVNWLRPARVLSMFNGTNYLAFVSDYEEQRNMLEALKTELANY